MFLGQCRLEVLAQKRVVAKHRRGLVERNGEHVVAQQPTQHRETAGVAGQLVAEVGLERVHDARCQQERSGVAVESIEDLAGEILRQVSGIAREALDLLLDVWGVAQGKAGQVHPHGPALRSLPKDVELRVVDVGNTKGVFQQRTALVSVEREILGASLGQLPLAPKSAHRQRKIVARGADQPEVGDWMAQEVGELMSDLAIAEHMDVVEHKGDALAVFLDRGAQRGDGVGDAGRACHESAIGIVGRSDTSRAQRGRDICPESHWLIVGRFERQPRDGMRRLLRQLDSGSRLSVTGGGDDGHEGGGVDALEAVGERGPLQRAWREQRGRELCPDDGHR